MSQTKFVLTPSMVLRRALFSTEQVMGPIGLNAVLRKANMERFVSKLPSDDFNPCLTSIDYARLNKAIEDFFGRASSNILTGIGENIFDQLIQDSLFAKQISRTRSETLPHEQHLPIFLKEFVSLANSIDPEWHVELQEMADRYVWVMHACPLCLGRTSSTPICHVYVGVLRGAVQFAGYIPRVEETRCVGMGAPACQFEIMNTPKRALVKTPSQEISIVQHVDSLPIKSLGG